MPLVIYSAQYSPTPSTTAEAPEFLTANLSPASPSTNNLPPVAPNKAKFPIKTFLFFDFVLLEGFLIIISPPLADFPTPSLHVPLCKNCIPVLQNAAKD